MKGITFYLPFNKYIFERFYHQMNNKELKIVNILYTLHFFAQMYTEKSKRKI